MKLTHIRWKPMKAMPQDLPDTIDVPDELDTLDKIADYVHERTGAWPVGYSADHIKELNL